MKLHEHQQRVHDVLRKLRDDYGLRPRHDIMPRIVNLIVRSPLDVPTVTFMVANQHQRHGFGLVKVEVKPW